MNPFKNLNFYRQRGYNTQGVSLRTGQYIQRLQTHKPCILIGTALCRSECSSGGWSVDQSVGWSVKQSVDLSVNRSVDHSVDRSVKQCQTECQTKCSSECRMESQSECRSDCRNHKHILLFRVVFS